MKFTCCVIFILTVAFRQNQNRIYCKINTDNVSNETHIVTFWHVFTTGISFLNAGAAMISAYATTVRLINKHNKVESRTLDRLRRCYTGIVPDDEFD